MADFAVKVSEIGPVHTVRIGSLLVTGSPRSAGESAEDRKSVV